MHTLELKDDVHMIIEGLYLGNFQAVMNIERLRKLNISHILILAYPVPTEFEPEFQYMCIEIMDDHKANLFKSLSEGIMFIKDALEVHSKASRANIYESQKGGCLVASTMGNSRSAAFIIGYLIYTR